MATQYAFGKIVTDGLVVALDAYDRNSYPSSGTTWVDMSGNGNSGTLINGPTFSNNSIVFDGANDYMDILDTNASQFQTNTLTIDLWIKLLEPLSNTAFKGFFSTISVSNGYQLFWNPSFQHFYFYSQTTAINTTNGSSYPSGTIFNLVCRFNTTTSSLNSIFFNGADITAYRFSSPTLITSSLPPRIGGPRADGNTQYFLNQNIYSVRFYNKVLSSQEIQQNYNAQKSRFGLS